MSLKLLRGTKEYVIVDLVDKTGLITDLTALTPTYTFDKPAGAGHVYNAATPVLNVRATATLTSDATNVTAATPAASSITIDAVTDVADNDEIVVGAYTYRFKNTMSAPYDVKRDGTTTANTLDNLKAAINGTGTPGTEYFAGTVKNADLFAGTQVAHAIPITAFDAGTFGDSLDTLVVSGTQITFPAATMGGSTPRVAGDTVTIDGVVYEFYTNIGVVNANPNYGSDQSYRVLKGSNAADSLQNLWYAINGTPAYETIKYGTNTTPHPTVEAVTLTSTTLLARSLDVGPQGNGIVTAETSAHLSWGGNFAGGSGENNGSLLRYYCLIDTTAGNPTTVALTAGTYELYVGFTNGSEVPKLGPIDIVIS